MSRPEAVTVISQILYTQSLAIDCMIGAPRDVKTGWVKVARKAMDDLIDLAAAELRTDRDELWEEITLAALKIMRQTEGDKNADALLNRVRDSILKTAQKPAGLG